MVPDISEATWFGNCSTTARKSSCVDNLTTGFDWAVPETARLIKGDAGDRALIGRIIQEHAIDTVIHFAGSVVVPESLEDPLRYYENNTGTTRNLVEAAVKNGVENFIFSSTAAVYGAPMNPGPIRRGCDHSTRCRPTVPPN